MTQIDEFESLFKAAAKPVFRIEPVTIHRVMILVDAEARERPEFLERVGEFLAVLNELEQQIETVTVTDRQFANVDELMEQVQQVKPDLVCTYRNLRMPCEQYPYSLGVYIDVLTQATSIPVLLLPRPETLREGTHVLRNTDRVIAMTDHLAGDSCLVTYAALLTQDGGQLTLAHIEDEQTFRRYTEVIGKIPLIETDSAVQAIRDRLLREATDYIESCRVGIEHAGLPITVQAAVTIGHHLAEYRDLIRQHEADLLVMNTKDEDQLAMHGLAYPLSVEIRDTPLLLI